MYDLGVRSKARSMVERLNGTRIIRSTSQKREYQILTLIQLIGSAKI